MNHNFQKDISGCGLVGIINRDGKRISGSFACNSLCLMNDRGNGLGAGYAAYGIYPEYKDLYAFHIMYDELGAKTDTEEYLKKNYHIEKKERMPTASVPTIKIHPIIWRYFIKPLPEKAERELANESARLEKQIFVMENSNRKKGGPITVGSGNMCMPLRAPVTSPFGWRKHPIFGVRKFHSGVDLAGPNRSAIHAADGGIANGGRHGQRLDRATRARHLRRVVRRVLGRIEGQERGKPLGRVARRDDGHRPVGQVGDLARREDHVRVVGKEEHLAGVEAATVDLSTATVAVDSVDEIPEQHLSAAVIEAENPADPAPITARSKVFWSGPGMVQQLFMVVFLQEFLVFRWRRQTA